MIDAIVIQIRIVAAVVIFLGIPAILGFFAGRPGQYTLLTVIYLLTAIFWLPVVVIILFVVGQQPARCGMLAASAIGSVPLLTLIGIVLGIGGYNAARLKLQRDRPMPKYQKPSSTDFF